MIHCDPPWAAWAGRFSRAVVMMRLPLFLLVAWLVAVRPVTAQVVATGEVRLAGTVETVTSDGLTVRDADGKSWKVRVQGKKQQGIALADGTLLAAPVEVTVRA